MTVLVVFMTLFALLVRAAPTTFTPNATRSDELEVVAGRLGNVAETLEASTVVHPAEQQLAGKRDSSRQRSPRARFRR
ncbi:hypothetical protein AMATHDRAFT_3802 [Amanita thiersii Skay4041]|uniref:Secreted protein n=1 Tax=Amanita thiersii Skay4041 TaxID=703135 RepID=A0A2A9NSG6_9AGAR|nr:hypothetical protein AMATHDRAFT_3802 [Amanita thiersii Skay4041]